MSEVEDYDDCFPPQALPIGTHKAGEKPQDGLQYLSIVHSEAARIPDVISADRRLFAPETGDMALRDHTMSSRDHTTALSFPSSLINEQVRKFSELRQYCSRMQSLHPNKLQGDQAQLNISKKTFDEEPCLSLVLSLSQVSVMELLDYIQELCLSTEQKSRVPGSIGCWVFSLLCVVDKPVPMDYMAIIRSVGRRCACLSSELFNTLSSENLETSSEHPNFQFLVLFILVCHYFEQFDLLQEFGVKV